LYYNFTERLILEIKVEKTKDEARAFLTIIPDEETFENPPSADDLKAALEENGIVYGIDESVLEEITAGKQYDRVFSVAFAKAPTVGDNAEINILKRPLDPEDIKPIVLENGDVDYFAPRENLITYVKKDEKLAIKIPATQGESGMTVSGNEIPGIFGADQNFNEIRGPGTFLQGNELLAEDEGVIKIKKNLIHVEKVFKINDDLGINTGSIVLPKEFDIHILIEKDVTRGFKLVCKTATINGAIEDAEIDVDNLKVTGGIVGTGDLLIKADILRAGYINGKRKIVARHLYVKREISSGATIYADKVQAYAIQGSTVVSTNGIWTEYLNGSNDIMVGMDYKAKEELDYIQKELSTLAQPMEQIKNTYYSSQKRMTQLKSLAKINPKHPLLMKELPKIKEISDKFKKIEKVYKTLESRKEELISNLYPVEDPLLIVRAGFSRDKSTGSIVEPYSTIHMNKFIKKVSEARDGGIFYIKKEKIWQSYRYNAKEIKSKFEKL